MEARVHFLSNFLEVCRLNHHGCPWSLRRVTTESRVGELSGGLHPDYQVWDAKDHLVITSNAIEMMSMLFVCDNMVQVIRVLVFVHATVTIGVRTKGRQRSWCRMDASRCSVASKRDHVVIFFSRFFSLRFVVGQEFLLKRTTGLSAIARAGPGKVLADLEAKAYAIAVLDELNASTPVAFEHKEKGAATAVLSMLSPSALQVHCARVFP